MVRSVVCEFLIYDATNLKAKRAVLKRILTRARQKFNVSIAEIGYQDKWQRTEIGFAVISDTRIQGEKEADQVLAFLDSFPEWERHQTETEWL
ncbi:DUF503 domain-containing protein [Listeria floridensis]|nr:DUF503 family protein [Listeria floridensis]